MSGFRHSNRDYSDFFCNDNLILFLDYYKTFDSLEHYYLLKTLGKIGFGDLFCRSIKRLYTNCNIFTFKLSHFADAFIQIDLQLGEYIKRFILKRQTDRKCS